MKSVLIMCNGDPNRSPRPNRMIRALKDHFKITVLARGEALDLTVNFIPLPDINPKNLTGKLALATRHKLRQFEKIIWHPSLLKLKDQLSHLQFDVIVCENLSLLPLALALRNGGKVLFDAREYFPRHFEDKFLWRFIFQPMNRYLCEKYLRQVDRMITVSGGIQDEYRRVFGVESEVITSFPDYHSLVPSPVDENHIRIIHHGSTNPSRKIDIMIKMMDHIDRRFHLDLMLVTRGSRKKYLKKLKKMVADRPNVSIIEPVDMHEIIPFTNQYDIGLFLCKPANFNLEYVLPNKLFEFIQARLAVAIGPAIEMRKFVENHRCGIVAINFEPRTMANELNQLTSETISYFKKQAHLAAHELSSQKNSIRIRKIVDEL